MNPNVHIKKRKENHYSFILRKNVYYILKYLVNKNNDYVFKISKNVDVTYGHLIKLLDKLNKLEIIENVSSKNKRKRIVTLTSKGKEMYKNLDFIYNATEKPLTKSYSTSHGEEIES